jgi:prepilin-type N-terminal cleavage/methylation domain-containing protein
MCVSRGVRAFSLIELLVVVGIIVILALLAIPVVSTLTARAQRAQCMANLKTLAVGANLYLQQNGSWPQIPPAGDAGDETEVAKAWVAALAPFRVPAKAWICPTIEQALGSPDYTKPGNERIDYIATPFDDKPTTPHEWPRQPWFIETGDVHGSGNLIIFTDGSISDLNTTLKTANAAP